MPVATWFAAPLFCLYLVGIGGSVLGLGVMLFAHSLRVRFLVVSSSLLSLGLALAAGGTAAFGQPRDIWLPSLYLATLCALLPLAYSPLLSRGPSRLLACVRDPRGQGGALIALSLLASIGWTYQMIVDVGPVEGETLASARAADTAVYEEVIPSPAQTDRGRPVRLFRVVGQPMPSEHDREWEARMLSSPQLAAQMIRTSAADPSSDCFGWTFSSGRYVIKCDEVKKILEDNAYQLVSDPRPGDLVVYTDEKGTFVHTGIVRAVGDDMPLLVESKWGYLGRYLHPAATPAYADARHSFYRSLRSGHLLKGLGGDSLPSGGVLAADAASGL